MADSDKKASEYQPTNAEKKLLNILLNPDHRLKTISEKCKLAGISRGLYYAIFKKPAFVDYYREMSLILVRESVGPVLNAFRGEALRGSYNHGKLLLEMAELYADKKTQKHEGSIIVNHCIPRPAAGPEAPGDGLAEIDPNEPLRDDEA